MYKYLLFPLLIIGTACGCEGQRTQESSLTEDNFETFVLQYQPTQREGVSNADFEKGCFFLEETRKATKQQVANFNVGDYWNVMVAFNKLQEPKAHIEMAFKKMITADAEAACAYIKSIGVPSAAEVIPEIFLPFYSQCIESEVQEKALDVEAYAKKNELSLNLVRTMNDIMQKDRQYRSQQPVNWDQQRPLDRQNQQKIDSLYQIHETYIGRSLVGKKLEFAMWAVIQHSDKEMMARYLPIINQAVRDGELDATCLKMLVDRYFSLTQKVQIFGSQQGVELANQQMRNAVMKQYGLE